MNKPLIAHTAEELKELLATARWGATVYTVDEAAPGLELPCIQLGKQNRAVLVRSVDELTR